MQNKINLFLIGIFIITCLFSCSYNKVSKVDIQNDNSYPITIMIKANNVSQRFGPIEAGQRVTQQFDWTKLNQEEGQFEFFVKNTKSGGEDHFTHGFIRHGELYNYIYLASKGDQLKVEISN